MGRTLRLTQYAVWCVVMLKCYQYTLFLLPPSCHVTVAQQQPVPYHFIADIQ